MNPRLLPLLAALALIACPPAWSQSFYRLGTGPQPSTYRAHQISADGRVVVGAFREPFAGGVPWRYFWWSEETGYRTLPLPSGFEVSDVPVAIATSGDGSLVAGSLKRIDFDFNLSSFELSTWSVSSTGISRSALQTPGDSEAFARNYDVSVDGSTIVGVIDVIPNWVGNQSHHVPARWVEGAGEVLDVGDNFGGEAQAVSADGSIAVGFVRDPGAGAGIRAARWGEFGLQVIGPDNEGDVAETWAVAVDRTGLIVLIRAQKTRPDGSRYWVAALWSPEGYVELPEVEGAVSLRALSADGSVIATSGGLWTAEEGFQSIRDLLEDAGLGDDIAEFEDGALSIDDIAADGRTILGTIFRQVDGLSIREPFVAYLGPGEDDLVINVTGDESDASDGSGACDADQNEPGNQCTLRAAIQTANARDGRDSISVDIDGAGPHTITLGSRLPALTEPLVLDATTQPGYTGSPLVVVHGGGLSGDGFVLDQGKSTMRALAIGGFAGAGIRITGPSGNRIEACHLGVSADGVTALPNGVGVLVEGSPDNVVGGAEPERRNLISGNVGAGVRITGSASTKNVIAGNRIGKDAAGIESVANGAEGIYVAGAGQNVIGGESNIPGTAPGNLIGGNAADGVRIEGTPAEPAPKNHVLGNSIGLNADGTAAVANGAVGVHVVGKAPETLVGGESSTARNVISGNADIGLWLEDTDDAAPALPTVEGNYIGVSTAGDALVPNAFAGILAGRDGQAADVGVPGLTIRNNLVAGHFVEINLLGRRSGEAIVTSNRVGLFANDKVAREAPEGTGLLLLGASRSIIGEPGKGNVIGGMATGLVIAADTVFVVGNRIGTNPAGTAARPNKIGINIPGRVENAEGVPALVNTGRKNVIGLRGTNLPQNQTANVISGNTTAGIRIGETIVLGGVGKNSAGRTLLSAVDGAISSGALGPADSNLVVSNFIGVGAGAIGGIGNGLEGSGFGGGIEIVRGTGNQILFNVIGENRMGIVLYPLGTLYPVGTAISFNSIGVTRRGGDDGTPRPNREWGIAVIGAKRTKIGFDVSGVDLPGTNVIQHNGAEGVMVLLPNSPDTGFRETLMTRNLFADNGGPAIAIRQGSIEGGDIEGVPNAPRLFLASRNAESAAIFGTIDEAADVEIYLSPSCDPSGRGEGARFSQVLSATAGERFQVLFSDAADNAAAPVGAFVTATATVSGTTTSEFSVCSRIADEDNTADEFVEPGATGIVLADLGLEVEIPASAAGSRAQKRQDGGTLYAMRYDLSPAHNAFAGSATSDDGEMIEPDAVAEDRYWTLTADGLTGFTYSVCLDVSDLPGAEVPGQLVVVHRVHAGAPWTPYASKLEAGGTRLCAEGLTAFGDLGIGGESLVNPVPVEPGRRAAPVPTAFALPAAYPNPARGTVTVEVALPEPGEVRVEVFDMLGRSVDVLLDGQVQAGTQQLTLNAGGLAAGVYLVHATSPSGTATRRVTVLR